MGPIYHALADWRDPARVSTSTIPRTFLDIRLHGSGVLQAEAITRHYYGTNNEFGFDYSGTTCGSPGESVQREHHYAIVDEVDSILIDEADALIISVPRKGRPIGITRSTGSFPSSSARPHSEASCPRSRPGTRIYRGREITRRFLTSRDSHCERLLNVENLYDPTQMDVLPHISQP